MQRGQINRVERACIISLKEKCFEALSLPNIYKMYMNIKKSISLDIQDKECHGHCMRQIRNSHHNPQDREGSNKGITLSQARHNRCGTQQCQSYF